MIVFKSVWTCYTNWSFTSGNDCLHLATWPRSFGINNNTITASVFPLCLANSSFMRKPCLCRLLSSRGSRRSNASYNFQLEPLQTCFHYIEEAQRVMSLNGNTKEAVLEFQHKTYWQVVGVSVRNNSFCLLSTRSFTLWKTSLKFFFFAYWVNMS